MNEIKLQAPEFLNPHWFGKTSYRNFPAVVENNSVTVLGVTLKIADKTLEEGVFVRVYIEKYFYAVLESEIEAREVEMADMREKKAADHRASLNLRRERAEAFNSTVNLPVKWTISQKEVLSGLGANSNGDGCYKNTVEHIELLDDLEDGRIRRVKGDFLCTSKSGGNGNSWSYANRDINFLDGDGNKYMPKPSCKQCLKLVERFRKKPPEISRF